MYVGGHMAKQTAADGHFVKHAAGRPNEERSEPTHINSKKEASILTRPLSNKGDFNGKV